VPTECGRQNRPNGRRAPSIRFVAMQDGESFSPFFSANSAVLPDLCVNPSFLFRAEDAEEWEDAEARESRMGQMTTMTMSDGADISVYHADAEGDRKGGLVLMQEIFGVTDHIRELCDEYAADGYEVLSPALFDREHPGFEADYSGPDFERAVELARKLHPFEQSVADAMTCIKALKDKGPVFMTGYCYGGSVSWRCAQLSDDLAAVSSYYGSHVPTLFAATAPKCATIAHFGRYDQGIPMEGVEALITKEHPTAQIFVYDANHGFNSDRRKDYHAESADLARERTLGLFKACG
jgi:carboxymethylenebutenolidase